MTQPDLKPCPFCGCAAEISTDDSNWPRWVDCTFCEAMGPTAPIELPSEKALEYVVSRWNRRTDTKMMERLSNIESWIERRESYESEQREY